MSMPLPAHTSSDLTRTLQLVYNTFAQVAIGASERGLGWLLLAIA